MPLFMGHLVTQCRLLPMPLRAPQVPTSDMEEVMLLSLESAHGRTGEGGGGAGTDRGLQRVDGTKDQSFTDPAMLGVSVLWAFMAFAGVIEARGLSRTEMCLHTEKPFDWGQWEPMMAALRGGKTRGWKD